MLSQRNNPIRFAETYLLDYEKPVSQNLAVDPKDFDELRKQGLPLSIQNVEKMYYEGSPTSSFNLPVDSRRGVDINDVWNDSKETNKRVSRLQMRLVDNAKKS